jgi:hypothetical protein
VDRVTNPYGSILAFLDWTDYQSNESSIVNFSYKSKLCSRSRTREHPFILAYGIYSVNTSNILGLHMESIVYYRRKYLRYSLFVNYDTEQIRNKVASEES